MIQANKWRPLRVSRGRPGSSVLSTGGRAREFVSPLIRLTALCKQNAGKAARPTGPAAAAALKLLVSVVVAPEFCFCLHLVGCQH